MRTAALLVIGYRIVFRDLVPKLLRGTALIHHPNNIVSRLAAKPHGIGKRCGQIHHFTGHRAYHRASRHSNRRCYRGYIRPVRQYNLNRTSGVIDLTVNFSILAELDGVGVSPEAEIKLPAVFVTRTV